MYLLNIPLVRYRRLAFLVLRLQSLSKHFPMISHLDFDFSELPPRLLSVKSKQPENMTFGGFPLHVLYMTEDGSMRLQRVGDEEVVSGRKTFIGIGK